MKRNCICLLVTLILFSFSHKSPGKGAPHTFTTPDGRSLEATILQFNSRNGKIQIKRTDGKKIWTLPTVFSGRDQEYIRQWILVDKFMSPTTFKISGNSKKDRDIQFKNAGSDGDKVRSRETTDVLYTITLQNRTGQPLRNLKIEYRAYILKKGMEGREDTERVDGGVLTVDRIEAGKKVSQDIPAIQLESSYITRTDYDSFTGSRTHYAVKTFEDDLKGFWIRIYGPSIDQEAVFREWCYPSDTKDDFEWKNATSGSF